MKRIILTVTNDLNFDQRMVRICSSLAAAGYEVTLAGRLRPGSKPLPERPFKQKRLYCFFSKGKLFYIEYNIRLFFYLLFTRVDIVCAIDLDTILPCYYVSRIKKITRVYDAHELFCEMQEIVSRPRIYAFWKRVEQLTVPKFRNGYTVNQPIADEFKRMYGVDYAVVRNAPVLQPLSIPEKKEVYILYQGAVNEGRSFETLIPAMQYVNAPLLICGDGNFMEQAKALVAQYGLQEKVIFKGMIAPEELKKITLHAWVGVTLFEKTGLSNYFSLANRFFDYIHAGIPQLCVDYPVYNSINNMHPIGVLIEDTGIETIAKGLNTLLQNNELYYALQQNCLLVREQLNWQQEEKTLLNLYHKIN
ncbi:MAG: glycosyltransferase [Chitinophagaceae bacterium]